MSTATKVFHSGMAGAPQMSGTGFGSLLAILQACLADGWGSATVDSLVIASGVATVTIGAGHPFEVDSVALVAGATTTGGSVNGERRVLSASSTSYSFAATGMPDQTATGTITHKVAPLGWAREFTGTNKAVYRPTDTDSTRMYLRVDDTSGLSARVVGYAAMSGVDTGTGAFPSEADFSGGFHWSRSSAADGTSKPWMIVGDSRGFYIHLQPNVSSAFTGRMNHYFGDFVPLTTPDAYRCTLAGSDTAYQASTATTYRELSFVGVSGITQRLAATRDGATPNPVARRSFLTPHRRITADADAYSGVDSANLVDYPNPPDNALLLSRMMVSGANDVRGYMPGMYCTAQRLSTSTLVQRERLTGALSLPGQTLLTVSSAQGVFFLSLAAWR